MVAPCFDPQRRQATRQTCNRVRSALTLWVNIFEGINLSTHHLSRPERSGQLRFLGSYGIQQTMRPGRRCVALSPRGAGEPRIACQELDCVEMLLRTNLNTITIRSVADDTVCNHPYNLTLL
jgi:hypothetical protein